MGNNHGPGSPNRVLSAAALLVAVAAGARAAYELLAPLLPLLVAVVVLGLLGRWLLRR